MTDERQEILDSFYWKRGPCCAGCDWWRHVNGLVGECRKSASVSTEQRAAFLGITSSTIPAEPGHILTRRGDHCGDFKDKFDWRSLPLAYLKRIGARIAPED